MSDEFNGSGSIDTTKWSASGSGGGLSTNPCLIYYAPTQGGDGYLHMTTSYNGNGTWNTSMSIQITPGTPANYYQEVRFAADDAMGQDVIGIWTLANSADGTHPEVDSPEGAGYAGAASGPFNYRPGANMIWWASDYSTTLGSYVPSSSYPSYYNGAFHTISTLRNNGVWTWYYDGSQVASANNPISADFANSPNRIIIQSGYEHNGCAVGSGTDTTLVDYVRTWHP